MRYVLRGFGRGGRSLVMLLLSRRMRDSLTVCLDDDVDFLDYHAFGCSICGLLGGGGFGFGGGRSTLSGLIGG